MSDLQPNERSPLEVPRQFVTKLLDDLSAQDESAHNHLSVADVHAFATPDEGGSEAHGHGHLIIVGDARQIQLVSAALGPTELSRVYDITYLETRNGSLHRCQPTPSWVCQDTQQTCRRAVEIYVEEERYLGADGKSPFEQFLGRFCLWYSNATGNEIPGKTRVASLLPLETTRVASSDGSVEKQVIWEDC